jgi:hypothetical protein
MIIVVVLVVTFLTGASASVLVLMRAGMNREHDRYLSNEAPTLISAAARVVSGLYVRMPERSAHADLCPEEDQRQHH